MANKQLQAKARVDHLEWEMMSPWARGLIEETQLLDKLRQMASEEDRVVTSVKLYFLDTKDVARWRTAAMQFRKDYPFIPNRWAPDWEAGNKAGCHILIGIADTVELKVEKIDAIDAIPNVTTISEGDI